MACRGALLGKTYGFCGDIGRGRTVRSLAMLLAKYADVTLAFVAPDHPKLVMRADLRDRLQSRGVRMFEVDSLEAPIDGKPLIEQVDALYMTRIQKEHDDPEDAAAYERIDFSQFPPDHGSRPSDEGICSDFASVSA